LIRPACPVVPVPEKRRMVVALVTSQRKAARSPPAETKRLLSEETERERTSWPWAV
jgi:hypothetical protein